MEQRTSFLAPAQFWGGGEFTSWGKCFVLGLGKKLRELYTCENIFFTNWEESIALWSFFETKKSYIFFREKKLGWNI